jgi:abscisate beta-glucosyltransferase
VLENPCSDSAPFVVPGLPDSIEMTRSQVPIFMRNPIQTNQFTDRMKKLEGK